ncbi:MAG: polyprenol monophosphomannose synthase [Anaerolineaceae bacterium]|nr:polyprenol monophosphomannose synthase [Anaerolineaceae bacterium]
MSTIVVIPTYNEVENLPLMVEALFALNIPDLSLLVVDDNSPDGTGQLADQIASENPLVSVLHRPEKQGLRPAYIAGFKKALAMGADTIVQMDCDFSHQPKYIPIMLEAIKDYDVVIGSRYTKGGSVDESWHFLRKALSMFANRIYTPAILGLPVKDATAGFRVWTRETLQRIDLDKIQSNGYIFQIEMSYVATLLGCRFLEVPIHFPDRRHGQSKMSLSIAAEAALRTWDLKRYYRSMPRQKKVVTERA